MSHNVNLVDLDFDSLKASLKAFLQNKPEFRDFNFEGSNINTLIELMAYNSYLNTFYMNMIANEMFIKTAQQRENIVKHAIELNYLPRSFRSAHAVVDIVVTPSNSAVSAVVMPRGTSFTTQLGSNTYTYTVANNMVLSSTNGEFTFADVEIYEGSFISDTFLYASEGSATDAIQTQRFILSNPQIDLDSLSVTVIENGGATTTQYIKKDVLSDCTSASPVYFVQAAENNQYEVTFGSGLVGRRPKDGSVIICEYRISSGELSNGADIFVSDGAIDGHSNVAVTLVSRAEGGAVYETAESIRFNAPRYFNTQNRAVTAEDYKTLLTTKFPEIDAINVYGGEEVTPPQYGVVYISVNQDNSDGISLERKRVYRDYIRTKTSLAIDPTFIDPEFTYISLNSTVTYNINIATRSQEDIRSLVLGAVSTFNDEYIDDFNSTLYFSKLTTAIDDSEESILSNDTTLTLYKIITPTSTSNAYSVTLYFDNPIRTDLFSSNVTHDSTETHGVLSSKFVSEGVDVYLEDDGDGFMRLMAVVGGQHTQINSNVGTVDYENGTVTITNVLFSSYSGTGVKLYVSPASKDVSVISNHILTIRDADVSITLNGKRE